jgi:plastocyanin
MRTRSIANGALALVLTAALAGCGGTTPSSSSDGDGGGGGGGTPTATDTITITASGANPRSITVSPGTRVTFVNNDSRNHDMASDPHPEHTQCPEINQAGFLTPGQSKATGNLNTVRVCGFHDHNDPSNASLTGTIRIQ